MQNIGSLARRIRRLTANALGQKTEAKGKRKVAASPAQSDATASSTNDKARIVELQATLAQLRAHEASAPMFVPPGHFYSAIPNLQEVMAKKARTFDRSMRTLPGIELREEAQVELLKTFAELYREQPFLAEKQADLRYHFENPAYSYSDAIFLYCMIRHVRPARIIEVGSGYSSCVSLDTADRFFEGKIACDFVEPYPELLYSLLKPADREKIRVHECRVQDMDPAFFAALEANDILFIDSTHVSKVGSDVNFLLFEVLPRLRAGVYVHFHDIFFPFEYPEHWIAEGRTWQEAYLLRAFLQFNHGFEIVAFNTFLEQHHRPWFEAHMPLCLKNPGGSIWLRRLP